VNHIAVVACLRQGDSMNEGMSADDCIVDSIKLVQQIASSWYFLKADTELTIEVAHSCRQAYSGAVLHDLCYVIVLDLLKALC
jgi:hypothetical protein